MRSTPARVALIALTLCCLLTACSGSDDDPGEDEGTGPTALTGGDGIFLASASGATELPDGWTEEELLLEGTATTYTSTNGAPRDGTVALEPGSEALFATRAVVRRPPAADFNGTVLVEWLNVSGGLDADPDFSYLREEILRGGYAWVGVSAQRIGIEGGPVAVGIPAGDAAGAGKGLKALDPERYGDLLHPGDAFSYDIYTQAAAAARDGALLDDLEPERVLAVGESQSGFALTTYANGVQPLTDAFDGFLLHSRGGAQAPLGEPGQGIDIASSILGDPVTVRTDLEVPVLTLETESDVVGVLNYLPSRQPDTDTFRLWEVAGTAHADRHLLGEVADTLDCGGPINDGPHHLVAKAALRALDAWVRDGFAPPKAELLEVEDGAYRRSPDGIVLGGIRTPLVDVPVDVLSGEPASDELTCLLFGSTRPLPDARLAAYGDRASYLRRFEASADAAVAAGFVLAEDREALLAMAQPDRLPE
ncbi:alpha/beta hydrolase domain-containing protein [Nocardioides dongkuii]|uniref:alpha/beta hydrolase domain-containing protein n=1 Tax=Nocardioides dongkuii TaxID=2760089 RepID=UPI001C702C79|nr:alpha/beta hydrolase domain-containing protein [Nocardioides dongkuii]